MKRFASVLIVATLLGGSLAVACDKEDAVVRAAGEETAGKEIVLTGYLTDSHCGATNAHAKGKACAIRCKRSGVKVQLLVEKKLYNLDKIDLASTQLGAHVTVTGVLDESTNTIRVESLKSVEKV